MQDDGGKISGAVRAAPCVEVLVEVVVVVAE